MPTPRRPARNRRPNLRPFAVLGLALLGAWTVARPEASPSSRVDQETLDRIQRECLHAYPPKLLAKMASGAQEIPSEVEEKPKAQMQFLDKEIPLDKGLFYPSLLEEVLLPLDRYVTDGSRFLDLGSGDGRVVFLAAVLGAEATGIEYDPKMVKTSRKALQALDGVVDAEHVKIVEGDFFEYSWSPYDVVFFFDLSSFAPDRVREKLRRDLGPDARLVVGWEQAPFPGFELEAVFPEGQRLPAMKVYRRQPEPDGGDG